MAPKQFGKYTLLEHMGKGGVGSVFRASDGQDGSIVAVKIFVSDEERPPEMSRKLRDREVRMLLSVQHPNIVKYRESGQVDADYYYAMEFVENSLLKRMRSGEEFDLADKVLILRQTTSALAAVHRQGIVHRDVKPGNILLDQDLSGAVHVKLTDLGIAKNVRETDIVREQMPTRVPGTAKYLSPEQVRLEAVDGRADIFGLGVLAYELLSGKPPFTADNPDAYLAANREQDQRALCQVNPEVPRYLSDVVDRMLVKDREERYDSDTLLRDLELIQPCGRGRGGTAGGAHVRRAPYILGPHRGHRRHRGRGDGHALAGRRAGGWRRPDRGRRGAGGPGRSARSGRERSRRRPPMAGPGPAADR
ncbi:MAG: serine/threonine protein kinase [Planctomycetota bacterium]|jgi:serine/threonine protein kinase